MRWSSAEFRRSPAQTRGRAQDDAGQPHAAQRAVEQNYIVLLEAPADFTIGSHHVCPVDSGAETSVLVAIFAVDACRNGTAERDELGPGRNHREPAVGQECSDDVAKKNTGFGNELVGDRIEGCHPVEVVHFDGGKGVDGTVAIGAAIAAGDEDQLAQECAESEFDPLSTEQVDFFGITPSCVVISKALRFNNGNVFAHEKVIEG